MRKPKAVYSELVIVLNKQTVGAESFLLKDFIEPTTSQKKTKS